MLTPFHSLHDYMALPRLTGLRLSPDGNWLAASVSALSADGRTFKPSIWRIPADPANPATRLTRSAEGEDNPAFLPDGSLLFLSARPAPPDDQPGAGANDAGQPGRDQPGAGRADGPAGKRGLWLLPAGGGEACQLTAPPGGISRLATAAAAALAAFTCPVLPGARGIADDAERRKNRADAGVTAILHEAAPVRHWDHDLGPDQLRLLVTEASLDGARPVEAGPAGSPGLDAERRSGAGGFGGSSPGMQSGGSSPPGKQSGGSPRGVTPPARPVTPRPGT